MLAEEFSEAGHLPLVVITITAAFAAAKAILVLHERVGVLSYLLANFRLLLEKCLQRRMVCDKFPVVHQGRILAKLLGNLAVAVHELIELLHFPARGVAITAIETTFLLDE